LQLETKSADEYCSQLEKKLSRNSTGGGKVTQPHQLSDAAREVALKRKFSLVKKFEVFEVEAYKKRLQLLRAMYGETQEAFADRLEIPFKRWNQYERGYPLPRDTAFLIRQKIAPGIIEWIWFGDESFVPETFRERIRSAEQQERERHKLKVEKLTERRNNLEKTLRRLKKHEGARR
jgi:transcriptional regulator with XRE-family HTH domain